MALIKFRPNGSTTGKKTRPEAASTVYPATKSKYPFGTRRALLSSRSSPITVSRRWSFMEGMGRYERYTPVVSERYFTSSMNRSRCTSVAPSEYTLRIIKAQLP